MIDLAHIFIYRYICAFQYRNVKILLYYIEYLTNIFTVGLRDWLSTYVAIYVCLLLNR